MARGWESKSVEQQQEELKDRNRPAGPRLLPAQQKLIREREGLLLVRKRLTERLQATMHARRRQMLEQDLAEIEKQLSSFEKLIDPSTPK
jgi:hypothetical protein